MYNSKWAWTHLPACTQTDNMQKKRKKAKSTWLSAIVFAHKLKIKVRTKSQVTTPLLTTGPEGITPQPPQLNAFQG